MHRDRHNPARALAVLLALTTPACFFSHGMEGDAPPRPPPGSAPAPSDPAPTPGAPAPAPDPAAPACALGTGGVFVSLTRIGLRDCAYGEDGGVVVYGVEASPAIDGVRLLVDYCPDADDDCRCAVDVAGIGTSVAEDVYFTASGGVRIETAPNGIAIDEPCAPDVECGAESCACVPRLVLYAADGSLFDPPVTSEAVSASWGADVCRVTDGLCDVLVSRLEVVTWESGFPGAIGTISSLAEGETLDVSIGKRVRALRTSAMVCSEELPRPAAWAAWAAPFRG